VPLARQRAIAERWRAAQGAVEAAGERIAGIERETQARFLADLGLILPERSTPPKAFALKWQDLERWSVMFNQLATVGVDVSTGKYPVAALGEIAAVSYGIQKCPANRPGQHARPYLRVANVQRGQLDLSEIKYINVPDSEMPSLRLEPGDLLVCEGNSADLVGRPAIWRGEIADCVHQNHILKVRLDRARALPEFVLEYMSSYPARNHFRARAKFTTNLASINSNDLRELSVSLPPLSVQRAIMERVEAGRAKIAREREAADRLRRETQAEVEAMILGAKPVEPQT
jgi:type I restriction enzyme S subunit